MKNMKMIIACAFVTFALFGAIVSCTKSNSNPCANVTCYNGGTCDNGSCICPTGYTGTYCQTATTSTLQFNNQTYTPITITVNGATSVIAVNSSVTYTGPPSNALTFSAYTYGTTTSGNQVGEQITWNNTVYFPSSGNSSWNLYTTSSVFFLEIQNNDLSYTGDGLYVNYGLTEQTYDNINIPNTGQVYNTGYYNAYTNTEIVLYKGTTSNYWYLYPTFSFTNNQYVLMTLP